MATINIPQPFILKNNILRTLLHEGSNLTLRLFKKASSGGGRVYTISLTSGWNHRQIKTPEKGVLEEYFYIVESPEVTQDNIDEAWGCDIVAEDDSFIRYNLSQAKSQINPITREWKLLGSPSKTEKSTIAEPV